MKKIVISTISVALLLIGCGGDNSSSNDVIVGTKWASECKQTNDSQYQKTFLEFKTDMTLTNKRDIFNNNNCEGSPNRSENMTAKYKLGSLLEVNGTKVREMDITDMKYNSQDLNTSMYTVYKIENNKLYFADGTATNDCSNKNNRCKQIDSSKYLIKQ